MALPEQYLMLKCFNLQYNYLTVANSNQILRQIVMLFHRFLLDTFLIQKTRNLEYFG